VFRLTVAYEGTAYAGWQVQPSRPTIQGLLTGAAHRLLGPDIRVTGASRTDAGVHALRQVASIASATSRPPEAVQGALNAALPPDVRVTDCRLAHPRFDARRAALGKRYAYLIDNGPVSSPLLRRFAWHVPGRLDLAAMRAALAPLLGRHDFSAYRAAPGRHQPPVCTVRAVHVLRRGARVAILFSADRFLHHMVRNLVGSAVLVGRGRRPPGFLEEVLAAGDRRRAGPTAPAGGLTLVRVLYPPARDGGIL
jgi:tRNA pseudouridine38-40 synthase